METKIWYRNGYTNVKVHLPPKDMRHLRAFLISNGSADCFVKAQGGYYKCGKDGVQRFVVRVLYLLSLKEWLEIALNDNYIESVKL